MAEELKGYTIATREIGIDMAHRVTNHGSKCRNIHGHRYKIELGISGKPFETGEGNPQEGMLLDFGFLKEEMMDKIDKYYDHGTTLWRQDPLVVATLTKEELDNADLDIADRGFYFMHPQKFWGKIVVVPFIPTAENLAKWWFEQLQKPVEVRSQGHAILTWVKVWETPNCSAIFGI